MSREMTINYNLEIARGNITGMSFVHKFGNAQDFDTGDNMITIWGGADDGTVWEQMNKLYSTSADIDSLSSSDAGDTQSIEVQGLDTNWDLVIQTKTLSGQTRVALDTSLIRVFRMKNLGSTDNAGHVFCFVNTADTSPADGVPDDGTKVRAVIHPGDNQTLMACYTIPNGKKGYLTSFFVATSGGSKTSEYNIELRTRNNGGVFQIKHLSNLSETASSHWNHKYQVPEQILAKTDIQMRAQVLAGGVISASITAGFDIILVDD